MEMGRPGGRRENGAEMNPPGMDGEGPATACLEAPGGFMGFEGGKMGRRVLVATAPPAANAASA